MKFSINLDFVYDGVDYLEAIREIKEIGFGHVEICFMQDKNINDLVRIQQETGIGVELMLSDLLGLTDAKQKKEFIRRTKTSMGYAEKLGCKKIIIASGDFLDDVPHDEQLKNIEVGVRELIPVFEQSGMIMLLEPINNRVDHPEAGLWSSAETFDMLRRINSPCVRMLFDIYHMQVMEGDVTRNMLDNLDLIDHVHCAGNPGRNEPFIGELNYVEIIRIIREAGFDGCVGIEYKPTIGRKEGLEKLKVQFDSLMG